MKSAVPTHKLILNETSPWRYQHLKRMLRGRGSSARELSRLIHKCRSFTQNDGDHSTLPVNQFYHPINTSKEVGNVPFQLLTML